MSSRVVVELAGVPIEIMCRNRGNVDFFQGYLTEKTPLVQIAPSDDELRRQRDFCLFLKDEGEFSIPELTDEYVEDVVIEAQIADLLVEYGTLQFHGSALRMDGEAYIFTAPSGVGKSTHARFWRETFGDRVVMINDDRPLVRVREDRAIVYGSPWNGKHRLGANVSAPLKAIALLNRGVENRIEPISAAEAFPTVFRQAHTSPNPGTLKEIMNLEQALLKTALCCRLYCNLSSEAATVEWRGMSSQGESIADPS